MSEVWFGGVVVITSASHAEGPQFEPGSNQSRFSLCREEGLAVGALLRHSCIDALTACIDICSRAAVGWQSGGEGSAEGDGVGEGVTHGVCADREKDFESCRTHILVAEVEGVDALAETQA